jgi:hypothetical protein
VLDWFGRALEAQVDYVPAYGRTAYALLPRWGGSHAEMLRLGFACIEQPRYDTLVPWQFVEVVRQICKDLDGDATRGTRGRCWKTRRWPRP